MSTLEWRPLDADDLPQLVALAQACLDAVGGLPQLAFAGLVRGVFFVGGGIEGNGLLSTDGGFNSETESGRGFGLVAGYGFAWVGHFFIEKNKPASFKYPLWSFISDYKMVFYMLTGKMNREVERIRTN